MTPQPDAPDGEIEAANGEKASAERVRLPDLLRDPFDIRSLALTGLFVLAIFYTAYFMRSVLLPVVLALFLSYLLTPLVRAMGRIGLRAPISATIILLGAIAVVVYGFTALSAPAAGWLQKAPYSLKQLQGKLLPLKGPMQQVAEATSQIEKLATPDDAPTQTAVEVKRRSLIDTLYVQGPEFIISTLLMLILLYFLLAYDGVFLAKLVRLMPKMADKKRAVSIARDIELHISRYLLTITAINIGLGIVVGTTVYFMGLRNPILWGVVVATLNFVPYIGALTGMVCMTLAAVLSFESFSYALLFPAVYLGIATIEGQLITPMVLGRSLTLNPILVLLAMTFWGWMWGITGIVLAVPMLAAFRIFCEHVEPMEPLAEFIS